MEIQQSWRVKRKGPRPIITIHKDWQGWGTVTPTSVGVNAPFFEGRELCSPVMVGVSPSSLHGDVFVRLSRQIADYGFAL